MENQSIGKGAIITIIILIVIVVVGAWGYMKYRGGTENTVPEVPQGQVSGDNTEQVTITAKHQYKNGKHIVAGEIELPTPCHLLETDVRIAESMPEQVTIDFTASSSAEMCAQVISTQRFKVEFSASESASIKATWNGRPAVLKLIPVGPNEDLTNFEVYIKG